MNLEELSPLAMWKSRCFAKAHLRSGLLAASSFWEHIYTSAMALQGRCNFLCTIRRHMDIYITGFSKASH